MIACFMTGIVTAPFWLYGFLGPNGLVNYLLPGHIVTLGTGISSYLVIATLFFFFYFHVNLSSKPADPSILGGAGRPLLWIALTHVFTNISSMYLLYVPTGLTVGHAGDFFELIRLSIDNSYQSISGLGYLPGVLASSKIISLLFYGESGALPTVIYNWILYFLISFLPVILMFFIMKRSGLKSPVTWLYTLALVLSHPFLLQLERGNWCYLSVIGFSLLFLANSTGQRSFVTAYVASLKILNLPVLPVFFLGDVISIKSFLKSLVFISTGSVLVLLFFQSQFDYGSLLKSLGSAGHFFQDAHVASAHSGAYALFRFFVNGNVFTEVDRGAFVQTMLYVLFITLLLLYAIAFYIYKIRRCAFSLKELAYLAIAILAAMKLLHHNNADMNLMLFMPFLFFICNKLVLRIDKMIFAAGMVLLFKLDFLAFSEASYIDHVQRVVSHHFTLRGLIYPSIYVLLIALPVIRMFLLKERIDNCK